MTVRNLIRILKECPPDAVVCAEDTYGTYEIDDAIFLEDMPFDNADGKYTKGDQLLLKA